MTHLAADRSLSQVSTGFLPVAENQDARDKLELEENLLRTCAHSRMLLKLIR
jgi:hypothetical protein